MPGTLPGRGAVETRPGRDLRPGPQARGHCRYCVDGWETYCTSTAYLGYTMDGSYAEYAVAWASHVVPVPDGRRPDGRLAPDLRRRDDVDACFEEVLAGEVPARLVFDMR